MSCRLVVAPRAEADLRESFLWYEQRSSGLGHDFIRCVETKFVLLAGSPQLFRIRSGPYRLAATERFPYAIYYRAEPTRVLVLAVTHTRQHPDAWRARR